MNKRFVFTIIRTIVRALLKVAVVVLTIAFYGAIVAAAMAIWWLGELTLFGPEAVQEYEIIEPTFGWVIIALAAIVWPYFHYKLTDKLDCYERRFPLFVWLDEEDDDDGNEYIHVASSSARYPSYPDNWQELRRIVLERDGYRCVNCGDGIHDATLHVHHIVPLIKGGSNNPSNLTTLCKDCHAKLHPHMR